MDELDLAFGILPLSIIVLSIIFTYIFKKVYIMPLVSIVVSVILMFTFLIYPSGDEWLSMV